MWHRSMQIWAWKLVWTLLTLVQAREPASRTVRAFHQERYFIETHYPTVPDRLDGPTSLHHLFVSTLDCL